MSEEEGLEKLRSHKNIYWGGEDCQLEWIIRFLRVRANFFSVVPLKLGELPRLFQI